MTPRDFCYWLQGHFEINEYNPLAGLSAAKVQIIKKHLELTFKAKVDVNRFPDANVGGGFCQFLDGVFAAADTTDGLSGPITEKVRIKLSDCFLHVIDPTFANRDELSRIHRGDGDGPLSGSRRGGVEAMC
jgi:hypothetical protein